MYRWFVSLSIILLLSAAATAGPFSLKGAKKRAKRSGEVYRLCLVDAEVRDSKLLPVIPQEVQNALPDSVNGIPWDIKVGPFSEDTTGKGLMLIGAKIVVKAAIPKLLGTGLIGKAAKKAVSKMPSGPDNETAPDIFAELSVGTTLMLRTPGVNGSTTPSWRHCANFKRRHLVGRPVRIRVVDYDVVRLDPTAVKRRSRGDVAGIVDGAVITPELLQQATKHGGVEQTLTATDDSNLKSVRWRIEAVNPTRRGEQ